MSENPDIIAQQDALIREFIETLRGANGKFYPCIKSSQDLLDQIELSSVPDLLGVRLVDDKGRLVDMDSWLESIRFICETYFPNEFEDFPYDDRRSTAQRRGNFPGRTEPPELCA